MIYPNAIFSTFAFIGFLMCAIPFPWHLEAWNTGTCLYMAWTGLSCLFQFINSIVWNRNAINWSPIWCDITARFIVGASWGIPASSLCINRRLYNISAMQSVTVTKAEKRRAVMIDLAVGLGMPIFGMTIQYIAQGHRFNIFEDVGCFPATYNTPVAYALVYCPPIAIGMVSAVYAILSIRAFNKSRAQFNELLSSYNNLNSSRYVRLMCLAGIEVACTVPLGSYAIYLNVIAGIRPWISWEDTHADFSRVDQIPALLWRLTRNGEVSIELTRWLVIICAFIFFGFFGFADEAKKNYRSAFETVAKRVGLSTMSSSGAAVSTLTSFNGKSKTSSGKIRPVPPIFVHGDLLRHHGSIGSLTDISVSIADVSGFMDEKKAGDEKTEFMPTLSYGAITLSDVGGTLADYSEEPYSAAPSSGSSSSASSIMSSPTSASSPSLPDPTQAKSNTHDIV
ncbi:pheromone B alpha 1 receptor [Pholiota conissans]|uniref:Pheromone B alpha 1 receptor n=1 Tax=Pholiota conissans TaxID=109636 RepID=A0A9P6CYM1_9AGAR|nr:pheromone B alpha 1 receptor [Pholiota conissans]